jgi:hypothetical protein
MRLSLTALLLVPLVLAGIALAQGDDCNTPVPISGSGGWAFDTSAASASGFAPCGFAFHKDRFWLWTATQAGDYVVDTCGSSYDTRLAWYGGATCAAPCGADNDDACGLQSRVSLPGVDAGDSFLLHVGGFAAGSFGAGVLHVGLDPCFTAADDALEDNDTCATAGALAPGQYTGLFASLSDADFYAITVPAGEFLDVVVSNDLPADLDLNLYDSACALLAQSTSDALMWSNPGAGPATVVVEVYVGPALSTCASYDLSITTTPDPCALGQDDGLEDNDSCTFALPLAAGAYPGLFCHLTDSDFYRVTLANGEVLDFTFTADQAPADLDLNLFDSACNLIQSFNADGLSYSNLSGAPLDVIVEVFVDPFDGDACSTYDLSLDITVDPCFVGADDALEDNDTCATAVALGAGSYPRLFCSALDPDFYRVTIPPGEELTFAWQNDQPADLEVRLFDGACNQLAAGVGDQVLWTNLGAAPFDVVAEVFVNPAASDTCADYDLDVSFAPDPCSGALDDGFEDNDDCAAASALPNGTYPGLLVTKPDRDYFLVTVADGDMLQLELTFTHANGDIDIFLYEDLADCRLDENVQHDCANALVCGFSASDNEYLSWANTSGGPETYRVEVNLWPPTPSNCNGYTLTVSGASDPPLGASYCDPAVPNSTGLPGAMSATGSDLASDNDLTLTASDLPDGQFAYFMGSLGQTFVPNAGGSQGNLCVANPAARWHLLVGQVANGVYSARIDTASVPLPPGFAHVIAAGESWNFQCWHRDVVGGVGTTSNYTNALQIVFQ